MRGKPFCIVATLLFLAASICFAQVRQATPEDRALPQSDSSVAKEVPSPMLIDISLGSGVSLSGKPRKAFNETPAGTTRAYNDATGYVCDKARVGVVLLRREEKHGKVKLTATTALSTEYLRQHVNLTVSLLSNGKEVRHEHWDDLVIGTTKGAAATALGQFAMGIGTSHSKAPTAEWQLTTSEWDVLWKDSAPTLRVILEIAN
jgi:hypothetical protein